MKDAKLNQAVRNLQDALAELQREGESPKEAVRVGASIGLIDNPELWIRFIANRSLSVHDYLGIDDKAYLESIRAFVKEAQLLAEKL